VSLGSTYQSYVAQESGDIELSGKLHGAVSQLQAWQTVADIVHLGSEDESKRAIRAMPSGCNLAYGACGFYDEEFGYVSEILASSPEGPPDSSEAISGALDRLRPELRRTIRSEREIELGRQQRLPEGFASVQFSIDGGGQFTDAGGAQYRYIYESTTRREGKFRVVYALLPLKSIKDYDWAHFLGAWIPALVGIAFIIHYLMELLRFQRLFVRNTDAKHKVILPQSLRNKWR
jgi:hypothetical protein